MRIALRKKDEQGFTLIELMIVVAIIGILAVLAIYGVRKYLASAKNAEATNTIGAINRASVAAFERESAPQELKIGQSANAVHQLCASATAPVPAGGAADVKNVKYTPDPAAGKDYHVGTQSVGWVCLKFEMSEPQYYAYKYEQAFSNALTPDLTVPNGGGTAGWSAAASGNLNGDSVVSQFLTGGSIINSQAVTVTQIAVKDAEE